MVWLVWGKTWMGLGPGRVEGASLEGLRDGRGPGGTTGDTEGWKNAERGAGWEGWVIEAWWDEWVTDREKNGERQSWTAGGMMGLGMSSHFNWELLIQPDSKSVLWLEADPEGKPRRAASPAAWSGDGRSQPSCAGGVLLALFTKRLSRRGKFPKHLHVYPSRMAMALLTPPQWGMEDVNMSTEQWQSGAVSRALHSTGWRGHGQRGHWLASTWWLCCEVFVGQLRLCLHREPEQHPGTDGLCSET